MSSNRPKYSALVVGVSAAVALATAAAASPAMATGSAISAPGSFTVTRTGTDLNTLSLKWKSVANAARYTVNIFDGATHRAFTVPAGTTSFDYTGSGVCTRYRAIVTAVAADGTAARTGDYLVSPLGAGGVRNLTVARQGDGATAQLKWDAPIAEQGAEAASKFKIVVKSMAKNTIFTTRESADTVEVLTGLDPAAAYVATITPTNRWGGCATTNAVVRGAQPGQVKNMKAERDTASPSRVVVAWDSPESNGYGRVTGYQIGYRSSTMRNPVWESVDEKSRSHELKLDPNQRVSVWVRAMNGSTAGALSKEWALERLGAAGAAAIDPLVRIVEGDAGKIDVTFTGPVGSSAAYPKMDVAIAPTLGGAGLREHQQVFNRAGAYSFTAVPCGIHTVTITGYGAGSSKEFARNVINRCQVGTVAKNLWKLVYGQATIGDNEVNLNKGGEARVVSTLPSSSQDMVFTTEAKLDKGTGYGIWTRANLATGAAVSGYSFQFDPGYAAVNPSFGKALLLRVWQDGRECGTPIAKVKWPTNLKVNESNRVMVVTKGDSLYATIDGVRMFDVPSLKGALASSSCGMKEPSGTQVGFRAWGSDTHASFHGTTINSELATGNRS